jgi:thiol:disulfide interchange protein DsbD
MLLIALLMTICLAEPATAQKSNDPTTWTYQAKRKFGNHFELFFQVKLKPGWHIYALDPGGDESLIPPTFTFSDNKDVKLVGKVKEMTKPVTEKMEGIDNPIRFFNGEAIFIQEVEVPWGQTVKITGKHEYQVCNDRMCLPPKTRGFSFIVKP